MNQEDNQTSREQYRRAYEMQKLAREEAEALLEEKSRELYLKNRSLEEALDKLSRQQAQLVMQEKLAAIGQLGAGLAHEINNPNSFIQSNIQTLSEYVQQLSVGLSTSLYLLEEYHTLGPDEDINQLAREIRESSDLDFIVKDHPALTKESLEGSARISHIANGLRYFAEPDLSQKRPMMIDQCIEQATQLLQGNEQIGLIQLDLESCPETLGLPLLISQAIANLLQNSIDANSDRKIIHVNLRATEKLAQITIRDQGSGIATDTLSQVFKPFFTTKKGHNGLGLGICQSILHQHQGNISVDSSEGKGTKVTVHIPMASPYQ